MDVMQTVPCFSFTCDAPNCELTFQNEDQLGQHRRKHSLSLKLPSKSSDVNSSIHVPVVDETPTPCRFLKNFSKVPTDFLDGISTNGESPEKNSPSPFSSDHNPFAETFRRASFSGPKLSIPDSATRMLIDENSESLNTPSITINPATESPSITINPATESPSITINPATESPEAGRLNEKAVVRSPVINTPFIPLVPGTSSTKTVIVKCLDTVQDTEAERTSDVTDSTNSPLIPLVPGTRCIRTLTVKRLESPKEASTKSNVSEKSTTLRASTLTSISKLVGKPVKIVRTIANGGMKPMQQLSQSPSNGGMKPMQQLSQSPLKKILPKPTSGDVQVIIRSSSGEITIPIPLCASNNSLPSSISLLKPDHIQSYRGMATKVAPTVPMKPVSSESIKVVSSESIKVSNESPKEPSTSVPRSCPNGSSQGSQSSSSSQSSISSSSQSSDTSSLSNSLSSSLSNGLVKKIGRGRRAIDETSEQRLARIRHKNRQAATRCRQKKRTWEQSLGSRIEQLKRIKQELMTEETNLKIQTAKLKKALLAHKECSQLMNHS